MRKINSSRQMRIFLILLLTITFTASCSPMTKKQALFTAVGLMILKAQTQDSNYSTIQDHPEI